MKTPSPEDRPLEKRHARVCNRERRPSPNRQVPRLAEEPARPRARGEGGARRGPPRRYRAGAGRRVHHGQRRVGRRWTGPGPSGRAPGRTGRPRGLLDHQQGLRIRAEGGHAGGTGHCDRRHRHRRRGRHGIDEQLPLHAAARARGVPDGERRGCRLDGPRRALVLAGALAHGAGGRGGRRPLRRVTRGPGHVRRGESSQGGTGDSRVLVQGRDPAGRHPTAQGGPDPARVRRVGATRHEHRGARQTAARFQEGRVAASRRGTHRA